MGDNVSGGVVKREISPGIFESMLEDYYPHSRYLKSAEYDVRDGQPGARGVFEIPSSCYCESSGHFNAVELVICFNQLSFVFFSEAIGRGDVPEMGLNHYDEFRELQLGGIYITRMKDIVFKQKIDPAYFEGNLHIVQSRSVKKSAFYRMEAEFSDSGKGRAYGKMNVAALQ